MNTARLTAEKINDIREMERRYYSMLLADRERAVRKWLKYKKSGAYARRLADGCRRRKVLMFMGLALLTQAVLLMTWMLSS